MTTLDIKETDVVELIDDNMLYFVEKSKGDYIVISDSKGIKTIADKSQVVNVWRHHL